MVELIIFILIIFVLTVLLSLTLFSIGRDSYNQSSATIVNRVIEVPPIVKNHPYRYYFLVESNNKTLKIYVSRVQFNLFYVGDRIVYKKHNGYTIIKKDIS